MARNRGGLARAPGAGIAKTVTKATVAIRSFFMTSTPLTWWGLALRKHQCPRAKNGDGGRIETRGTDVPQNRNFIERALAECPTKVPPATALNASDRSWR